MHIKVEDGHALQAVLGLRVRHAHHDIVEDAEAARLIGLCVVPRRPHHDERAPRRRRPRLAQQVVDCCDDQPGRAVGCSLRARLVDDGVAVEVDAEAQRARRLGPRLRERRCDALEVFRCVYAPQLLLSDVDLRLAHLQQLTKLGGPGST